MSVAVLAYLAVINVITFGLYGLDKYRAMNNMWRIPEKTLLGAAAVGGAYGAYLGMRIFHHKTKHLIDWCSYYDARLDLFCNKRIS